MEYNWSLEFITDAMESFRLYWNLKDFKNLNDINDDILDIILYFQDIFSIKNVKINNVLINCIFYYIGFPILIGAITSLTKVINLLIPAKNKYDHKYLYFDSFVQIYQRRNFLKHAVYIHIFQEDWPYNIKLHKGLSAMS